MKNLWRIILEWLKGKAVKPVVTPDVPPVDTGAAQTLWPAYVCLSYAGHGYESENTDREDSHIGARNAGLDCIRFRLNSVPNPELSIHLFWYESDKERGKFLGTWYKKALAAGVTRWQIELGDVDYAMAYDRFKAYPRGAVQWIIGKPFTQSIMAALHCDPQGVKISEPEYRK